MTAMTVDSPQNGSRGAARHGIFHFLAELRRRRVCRAITMYSVAIWLVCQIVDVISPALQLPDWTLNLVMVLGLLGLPVIIITSWLFEITPDGLVVEGRVERREVAGTKHHAERLIDCSLILAALAICGQLAFAAIGIESEASEVPFYRIAVLPFRAAAGDEAAGISAGLEIEMQHALRQQPGVTVIASRDPALLEGSMGLTGVVSVSGATFRVAVTMTDLDSGVVAWSAAFQQPRAERGTSSADIARQIVTSLPMLSPQAEPVVLANVSR